MTSIVRQSKRQSKTAFPKKIHFIWFQGAQKLPDKYLGNISSFHMMNPNWEHVLWDDRSLQTECSALSSRCLQTYLSFEHMHQKIDFGRYVVLFRHGGTSVDIDMVSLRPFDTLSQVTGQVVDKHEVVISYAPASPTEARVAMIGTGLNFMYNNAWILSKRYAKPMLFLIEEIIKIAFSMQRCGGIFKDKYLCIMSTTGPVAFTCALAKTKNILILDKKYFENCVGWQDACKPAKEAFVFHEHDNTWIPQFRKEVFKLYFKFFGNDAEPKVTKALKPKKSPRSK